MFLLPRHYLFVLVMIAAQCCELCCGESIRFDAPAILEGELIADSTESDLKDQKIVQFVIPISATFDGDARVEVDEISAEVHWNRDAYPVVEFSPRTAMQSTIDGAISIEKYNERNSSAGVNLSSGYFDMLSGAATLGLSGKSSETQRYNEIPKHDILNSSGTIDRGTGVQFRFKPSRTSTLEGGRELVVTYRVPETWRTGILQVTCRASGKRRIVGLWGEEFDQGTTFVLPVYLNGDQQAWSLAKEFVRAEQSLRRNVHVVSSQTNDFFDHIQSLFAKDERAVVEMLIHRLIQSDKTAGLNGSHLRLPRRVENSARQFVLARKELMNLNRYH